MKTLTSNQNFAINFFKSVVVNETRKNNLTLDEYLEKFKTNIVIDNFQNLAENEILETLTILKEELISNNDLYKTFYKNFEESKKDRLLILQEQALHYLSTYGTDFSLEYGYLPNTDIYNDVPENSFVFVTSMTEKEFFEKIKELIYSNVALDSKNVKLILEILLQNNVDVDLNKIQNKELNFLLKYNKNQISNIEDLVRALNYVIEGSPLLIKSKNLINRLRKNDTYSVIANKEKLNQLIKNYCANANEKEEAKNFNRYKKVFLAIKKFAKSKDVSRTINKISRLSKQYHKPVGIPDYLKAISDEISIQKFKTIFKNLDFQYKIKIANALKGRYLVYNSLGKDYFPLYVLVRNGRKFITQSKLPEFQNLFAKLEFAVQEIKKEIVEKIITQKVIIKNYDLIDLAIPTSEKQFVGEYPVGTKISFGKNDAIIGISWKGKGVDFDLSAFYDGNKIGWDSHFSKNDIFFSGDITSAPKGATELIYIKNVERFKKPISIAVNLYYTSDRKCNYKFFIANSKVKPNENFEQDITEMIGTEDILFSTRRELGEAEQENLGIILGNKFIFLKSFENSRVSTQVNPEIQDEAFVVYATQFLSLSDIFKPGEIEELNKINDLKCVENQEEPKVLDLSNISKSEIFDLFFLK